MFRFVFENGNAAENTPPPNSTIIIAIPSYANIAQMAMDSLICSCDCQRFGFISCSLLTPFIGYDSFHRQISSVSNVMTLCLPIEVYQMKLMDGTYAIAIQIRSDPLEDSSNDLFSTEMINFVKRTFNSSDIYVLGGYDIAQLPDESFLFESILER